MRRSGDGEQHKTNMQRSSKTERQNDGEMRKEQTRPLKDWGHCVGDAGIERKQRWGEIGRRGVGDNKSF